MNHLHTTANYQFKNVPSQKLVLLSARKTGVNLASFGYMENNHSDVMLNANYTNNPQLVETDYALMNQIPVRDFEEIIRGFLEMNLALTCVFYEYVADRINSAAGTDTVKAIMVYSYFAYEDSARIFDQKMPGQQVPEEKPLQQEVAVPSIEPNARSGWELYGYEGDFYVRERTTGRNFMFSQSEPVPGEGIIVSMALPAADNIPSGEFENIFSLLAEKGLAIEKGFFEYVQGRIQADKPAKDTEPKKGLDWEDNSNNWTLHVDHQEGAAHLVNSVTKVEVKTHFVESSAVGVAGRMPQEVHFPSQMIEIIPLEEFPKFIPLFSEANLVLGQKFYTTLAERVKKDASVSTAMAQFHQDQSLLDNNLFKQKQGNLAEVFSVHDAAVENNTPLGVMVDNYKKGITSLDTEMAVLNANIETTERTLKAMQDRKISLASQKEQLESQIQKLYDLPQGEFMQLGKQVSEALKMNMSPEVLSAMQNLASVLNANSKSNG